MVMLPGLGPTALDDLAAALEAGRLRAPFTRSAVRRHVPEAATDETLRELSTLESQHFTPTQAALLLRTLARERRHQQQSAERLELVWSGPDAPGTSPRDTAVVIRDLCRAARRSVLIANWPQFKPDVSGRPQLAAAARAVRREGSAMSGLLNAPAASSVYAQSTRRPAAMNPQRPTLVESHADVLTSGHCEERQRSRSAMAMGSRPNCAGGARPGELMRESHESHK